jgi:nucleoside-diphosphate-sugar epimerase
MVSSKRILVLGGTGHLGSAIVHSLVFEYKVPVANIRVFYLPQSPTDALANLPGLDLFPGNILDAESVAAAMEGIQLVFHVVGHTSFDPRQKEIQWKINVEGTRNVLEACKNSKSFERLCYTSTVNALGLPQPLGSIGELEHCSPYISQPRVHCFKNQAETLAFIQRARNTPAQQWLPQIGISYFDSKLAAQELVNYYTTHFQVNTVSIYPGTMFGPYDHFIGNGMYLLALYRNKMLAVLAGGLPLTHVFDVAEGSIQAIQNGKTGGHYVLTGQRTDHLTLVQMTQKITDRLQLKFPNQTFRAPRIVISVRVAMVAAWISETYAKLSNTPCLLSVQAVRAGRFKTWYGYSLAEKDFGYNPRRSFEQAVDDMIDYYQKHGLFEATGRYIDRR